MARFRQSLLLLATIAVLSIVSAGNDVKPPTPNSQSPSKNGPIYFPKSCTAAGPLYAGSKGKPIRLTTSALLKRATHCKAPEMPGLARHAEIEGYVSVDIVVNYAGRVRCARIVSGHPLLAQSAIEAAKDWTFRPMEQDGKAVWFHGHLRFHFSTGGIKKGDRPCTVAHLVV